MLPSGDQQLHHLTTGLGTANYLGGLVQRAAAMNVMKVQQPTASGEVPDVKPGQDFFELLRYSDSNGLFGSKTSTKLAAAFAKHHDEIKRKLSKSEFATYDKFQAAFALAGNQNGVVVFS